MTIRIDDARFQEILEETVGSAGLSARDARDLIAIAQLAAWIVLKDDQEESTVLDTLTDRLCAQAGIDASTIRPLSPVPIDREERVARICELAARLDRRGTRELAYVLAYLVVVSDQELAPVESSLLRELERTLAISSERASELVYRAARIVTPLERRDDQPTQR